MPTPKPPEKQSVRRPPPGGLQSAPPPSSKGRAPAESVRKASATEVAGERKKARAPSASEIDRADELVRQMTIEEKAMQLSALYPMGLLGADGPIKSQLAAQVGQGIGHICGLGTFGYKTPATIAKTVNAIQRYLVTETRLKIPAIFHNEALNGVVESGLGFAIASRASVIKAQRLGDLVTVPLKPRLMRTLYMVYPKEKFRSRLVTTFVEFASKRMRENAAKLAQE